MRTVSGAHYAVIVDTVVLLACALELPRLVRTAVAVGFPLASVVLVRPHPPNVRATVILLVVLVVHLSECHVSSVPLIALAVVAMLVVDPSYPLSFAFSRQGRHEGYVVSRAASVGSTPKPCSSIRDWSRRRRTSLFLPGALPREGVNETAEHPRGSTNREAACQR